MSTYDSIPASQAIALMGTPGSQNPAEIESWQVSRSLSGGGLPQQARATSGSSVGSGSLTIDTSSAFTPNPTPWSTQPVVPGGAVSIDARADAGQGMARVATMAARSVAADSWLDPRRHLSIEDEVPRGQASASVEIPGVWAFGTWAFDPSAIIAAAGASAGYRCQPAPSTAARLHVPLVGSLRAHIGDDSGVVVDAAHRNSWGTVDGQCGWVGEPIGDYRMNLPTDDFSISFFCSGSATLRLIDEAASSQMIVTVSLGDPDGLVPGTLTTNVGAGSTGPGSRTLITTTFPAVAPGTWARVTVTFHLESDALWFGQATAFIDAGQVATEAFDSTVLGIRPAAFSTLKVETPLGAIRGIELAGSSAAPEPFAPTASIAAANSPLDAIAEPTSGDAWEVIQQVSAATLGACWIDEDGRLIYRNRDQLRGGVPQYTIEALDHAEDVPWSISTDEIADRVEFTYRPPTVSVQANDTLTVWSSQETVRVAAGATVRLDRDIDGAAAGLAPWFRHEDVGTYPLTRMSRYAAWTAPPGESGSAPPDGALVVSSEMLSPTRIRVSIRNTTGAAIWLYELIARARTHVQPGADVTISRGLPEAKAQCPLQINAGSWVQDDTTANQIADWLESQTANPLPTIPPVRVIPDASRRLGDVVRVRIDSIGGHEPVVFKALISSIDNSQSAGTYEQRIGFTILAVTFDDWQRWGEAHGITTFDQLQAALSHLTTFDALDHWLTDLGGDL